MFLNIYGTEFSQFLYVVQLMELKYHIQISSHQHFSIGNNQLKTACLQLNVCIFCLQKATDERAGYKQMTSQEIGL